MNCRHVLSGPPRLTETPVRRPLGLAAAIALVMGNMIGSGVFLLPASLAPFGWNAVAGWALTIVGALALAHALARLTRALPGASGPVEMVEAAFGPVPAFMIGWSYWVSIWTANATIAIAGASYLSLFVPDIATRPGMGAATALALLWLLTLLNLRGARAAGGFQLATLLLKLIPLIVVIAIAAIVLFRSGSTAIAPFPAEGLQAGAITASASLTLWALLGFESASAAADKVADPERNIPRATMLGTLATGLVYILVCSAIALMLPPEIAAGSDAPFADFVRRYWAPGPAYLIGLFAAISAIGALNGWILLQGEVPLAMARAGRLPRWLAHADEAGTPRRALLVSSVLASVLLVSNSLKTMGDLFNFMALLSTSASLWLYLACAGAALRLKLAVPVAAFGAVYAIWTLWGAGPGTSLLSLVLMLGGLPFYLYARRRA